MPSAASHPAHAIYCQPAASFYTCPERRSPFARTLCGALYPSSHSWGSPPVPRQRLKKTLCRWLKPNRPFDLTTAPDGEPFPSGFRITADRCVMFYGASMLKAPSDVLGKELWRSLAEQRQATSGRGCGQLTVGVAGSAHFLEDWWSSAQLGPPPGSQPTTRFQGLLVTDGKVSGSFYISFPFFASQW